MYTQVYDSKDGSHLDTLRGHRDTVYTLSYSRDGQSMEVYVLPIDPFGGINLRNFQEEYIFSRFASQLSRQCLRCSL